MPVMDGYELIKNLKDNPETSKIPVLLLTGQEEERVSIEGMVHPPNDFIPKPFAKADLLEKVKKLLSQGV